MAKTKRLVKSGSASAFVTARITPTVRSVLGVKAMRIKIGKWVIEIEPVAIPALTVLLVVLWLLIQ